MGPHRPKPALCRFRQSQEEAVAQGDPRWTVVIASKTRFALFGYLLRQSQMCRMLVCIQIRLDLLSITLNSFLQQPSPLRCAFLARPQTVESPRTPKRKARADRLLSIRNSRKPPLEPRTPNRLSRGECRCSSRTTPRFCPSRTMAAAV